MLSPEVAAQVEGLVELALRRPLPSRAMLSEAVRELAWTCAAAATVAASAGPGS